MLTEGGVIDFWPRVPPPENPLIAFVLLPVSLSPVSLPLMKLQMKRPPPSCLSRRPASCLRSRLQLWLRTSLSVLPLCELISLFIALLRSVSLFLSLSSAHASIVLLSLFSPVSSLWSCSWRPPSFFCVAILPSSTYVEAREVASLWSMSPEVLLGFFMTPFRTI